MTVNALFTCTLSPELATKAARSIGDTYLVAAGLPDDHGAALILAGKTAFRQTHTDLLTLAAAVIMALAVVVFIALSDPRHTRRATDH